MGPVGAVKAGIRGVRSAQGGAWTAGLGPRVGQRVAVGIRGTAAVERHAGSGVHFLVGSGVCRRGQVPDIDLALCRCCTARARRCRRLPAGMSAPKVRRGAVKVGPGVVAPLRVTAGPPVCVHLYLSANDSSLESDDSNPFSFTAAPVFTCWSGPAFAVGARLAAFSFTSEANAGAVLSSIVLGGAASSTSPGSQPNSDCDGAAIDSIGGLTPPWVAEARRILLSGRSPSSRGN